MNNTKEFYANRKSKNESILSDLKNQNRRTTWLRGASFLSGVIIAFALHEFSWQIITISSGAFLIPLFLFIKKSFSLKKKIRFTELLIKTDTDEISVLNNDYSMFDNGNDFKDPYHRYSFDMDLFGQGSVFQFLNRTFSKTGAYLLSRFLKFPEFEKQTIINRQKAVEELSQKPDWIQDFRVSGMLIKDDADNTNNLYNKIIESTLTSENQAQAIYSNFNFITKKGLRLAIIVLPILSAIFLVLTILSVIPEKIFVLWFFAMITVVGFYLKKINTIHNFVSKTVSILNTYILLLQKIENEEFNSDYLNSLKLKTSDEKQKASELLNDFRKLVNAFDNRLNILFAFLANGLVLWDLHCVFRIEDWLQKHQEKITVWFEVIGHFDALSSFANFKFNNPNYTFPEITTDEIIFDFQNAGHPLIPENVRVSNDFKLTDKNFCIITGANMAGKSTFLRTFGVNSILAMSGSVVCADFVRISPLQLFTSVRIDDSLQKQESYFYAELKRLQSIIRELEQGKKMFIIVDEMLRGTNSKDKHTGSLKFIEKLVKLGTTGIIATHDLGLTDLDEKYPDNIKNKRFEVDIDDDKLHFDYKIKEGVSQNLNATFLMEQMEII